jgi:hypothetical protein
LLCGKRGRGDWAGGQISDTLFADMEYNGKGALNASGMFSRQARQGCFLNETAITLFFKREFTMSKAADESVFLCDSRPLELYYFVYGPNMNSVHIGKVCSKPKVASIARLSNYRVDFFGHSPIWDGAQESVVREPGHDVWGVVYALSASDKERLDDCQDIRMDGTGSYFHYPARVDGMDGRTYTVLFYKKDLLGKPEMPSSPYLELIIAGAEERGLPAEYIRELRAIESRPPSYPVPRLPKFNAERLFSQDCSSCAD